MTLHRCRRALDAFGDHKAARAYAGVLQACGKIFEKVIAQVRREAGARVTKSAYLRDLHLTIHPTDQRRLEVVANGSSLWGGAQLTVDSTVQSGP